MFAWILHIPGRGGFRIRMQNLTFIKYTWKTGETQRKCKKNCITRYNLNLEKW